MRRKPQLGAELRREEKTKTRNEKNSYYSHSPLRRPSNHPQTCWLDRSKHQTCACCSAYPGPSPSIFFFCTLREGGTRARPWVSRRGASFQHAYFPPKHPYLPDLVINDSLFQVQHRLDYLVVQGQLWITYVAVWYGYEPSTTSDCFSSRVYQYFTIVFRLGLTCIQVWWGGFTHILNRLPLRSKSAICPL